MSEDVVVIPSQEEGHGRPSNLPKSFIEALSAIQEMAFIEGTRDDPESYSQAFTLINRLHFFWAGFSGAVFDVLLTYFGVFFYGLASAGIISMFGREVPGTIDHVFGFLLATVPFLATFFLIVRIYAGISGTISKMMAFWLALGFLFGCSICSVLLFLGGSAVAYDYAEQIYLSLSGSGGGFFYRMAEIFWDAGREVLAKTSWREFVIAHFCGAFVLMVYFGKAFELWRRRKNAVLE